MLDLVQRAAETAGPQRAPAEQRLSTLTDRERDSAIAIARGASNAEIAAELYISTATVKAAVSRILRKLDLTNRTQIAVTVRARSTD